MTIIIKTSFKRRIVQTEVAILAPHLQLETEIETHAEHSRFPCARRQAQAVEKKLLQESSTKSFVEDHTWYCEVPRPRLSLWIP